MADIKKLSIFGNQNKGLNKIRKESQLQKEKETDQAKNNFTPEIGKLNNRVKSTGFTRNVGAPIKNHDQVFSAKSPLKLSAIIVSLTRVLNEKYMTENSRDEILRLALNDYIKHNLTKEDKSDLLHDMEKELSLYREKHPTYIRYDDNGRAEATVAEVEAETMDYLEDAWGIN